ncbi:MAG: TetR/AcrR family transcriptional regulator [Hyphomicrobiaceae bacterium]
MPKMSQTEQPYRQRLEVRMIDIAERLIERKGLAAVQARRLTQEAHCSVGTLYNVFGGLDAVIIAVNIRTLMKLGIELEAVVRSTQEASPDQRLLALARAYHKFAHDHSSRWLALFEHRMAEGAEVPDDYRNQQRKLFTIVEAVIAPFVADDAARASAAQALFSAVHGIVKLSLEGRLAPYDPAETERQIRFIVSNAAQGLQSGG